MYSLVEQANNSYDIVLANNVISLDDTDTCVVKYAGGKKFKGRFILTAMVKISKRNYNHSHTGNTLNSATTSTPVDKKLTPAIDINLSEIQVPNNNDNNNKQTNVHHVVSDLLSSTPKNKFCLSSNLESSVTNEMSRIAEKVTNVIGDKWLNNSNQSNSCISRDKISSAEILKSKKIQMSPNIDDSQNLTSPFKTLHENSINPDSDQISEQLTFEKNTEASSLIDNSQNDPDYSQDASFIGENINSSKNDKNCESLLTEVKSYFCPYCHSVQTKFARHLELKHKDNPAVQQFMSYDKKNKRRAQLIAIIRKEGRYLHNTNKEFNTGILMTARQRQRGKKLKKKASDYVCCAKCKDWYSKATIRMHFVKCDENHKKGEREILKKRQRKANFIHSRANDVLRRDIFPVFRDGILKETNAFDELLILYGNKLCNKHSHKGEYDMIRAELRYLAKHLIAAKKIDSSIKDYSSLIWPLLRKYAEECGAQFPERLRAIKLRRHVATCTAMIGLKDMDVDRLANFMGHHKEIHKNIYRVDVPVAEITLVGKLLKSAMSSRKNKNPEEKYESSSSSDDSNDEYDEDSENCILEPELEQSNEKKVSVKISRQLNKRQRTSTDERSKKKRKISSRTENVEELEKRKIIRNQWTDEENAAVVNEFGTLELLKKVPSVFKCQNVINNNPALKKRTVEQLRAHINNQLRKQERLKSSTKNLDE
ncbi:hypothetical protein KQX54_006515 [Cotesia glomerata]|uniref:Uncharacterized protein n=1 Tax=Cotesia glomerata TaxID=32391 RepID=A0AAV7ILH6_COTGL|nr:hypothetical protein KQX54_006515 [Cotesia glomerata]